MGSVASAHYLIPSYVEEVRKKKKRLIFTTGVKVFVQRCICAFALGILVPGVSRGSLMLTFPGIFPVGGLFRCCLHAYVLFI